MTTDSSAPTSKLQAFLNSTLARLGILLVILGLAFAGNAVATHIKHDKYADARRAADSFLTAYTHCDVQTAKKYYLAFQTDAAAVSSYQKQCVKGAISFNYDAPSSYTTKTVKHVQTIDVELIYSASQKGRIASKFLVHMQWHSSTKQWTISSISAAPSTTTNQTSTKAS